MILIISLAFKNFLPLTGIKLTPSATLKLGGEEEGTIVSQHVASTSFLV